MYRYYITRKTPEGVMEYPAATAPNVIESYGQNGSQFEGFTERFWGYVEFEKELPGSDLDAYGLVPGPSPEYHPINENMARRAKEMMSFSEYVPGSATWDYRLQVDKASMVAQRQKQRTDPMYHEKIDGLLAAYSRRLAANLNDGYRIGTMCPSVLISGGSNFPVRKKERQNARRSSHMERYEKVMGIKRRIASIGTGGIQAGDPNALERLEAKAKRLEDRQDMMKRANAHYRKHGTLEGFDGVDHDEAEHVRHDMERFGMSQPFPSWQLSNNLATIKRTRARIAELQREKEAGTEDRETEINGEPCTVVENADIMRLQLVFGGKPKDGTRERLKANGFRWSPKNGAWQRQLTDNARRALKALEA